MPAITALEEKKKKKKDCGWMSLNYGHEDQGFESSPLPALDSGLLQSKSKSTQEVKARERWDEVGK